MMKGKKDIDRAYLRVTYTVIVLDAELKEVRFELNSNDVCYTTLVFNKKSDQRDFFFSPVRTVGHNQPSTACLSWDQTGFFGNMEMGGK